VPDPLFNLLLEQIDDVAELKVTLRAFWLAHQKKGAIRAVSQEEFFNDRVLVQALKGTDHSPQAAIQRGLELAIKRQTLLAYEPDTSKPEYQLYVVNTESSRRALQRLQGKDSTLEESYPDSESGVEPPTEEKPNIFAIYENNIGTISPMLAEQLKEAEDLYPWSWISEAFKIAVTQNKRSWAYISSILRRWSDEGRDHGEPGRHPEEDNREKYVEKYRRLRGHLPWEPADR
jgi:DnaD/phage-associated family protein